MTHHDLALAQLAMQERGPDYDWDHYEDGPGSDEVIYGIKLWHGNVKGICFHGSRTRGRGALIDWITRDFWAFADPFRHDALGPLHPGFYRGMEDVWNKIRALYPEGPYVIHGHSLGAGRATQMAGLMVRDGIAPKALVRWGEPLSCFLPMADLIAAVPKWSYRNTNGTRHDLVTDVPLNFLCERYVRCGELTDVCSPPSERESFDPFAWHGMAHYAAVTPEAQLSL